MWCAQNSHALLLLCGGIFQDPALLQAKLRTYVDKLSEVHEIQTQQRELTRRQAEVTSRLASVGSDSTELQSTGLARELVSDDSVDIWVE